MHMFSGQKSWAMMGFYTATPFQDGGVEKQGHNGGIWLVNNFM